MPCGPRLDLSLAAGSAAPSVADVVDGDVIADLIDADIDAVVAGAAFGDDGADAVAANVAEGHRVAYEAHGGRVGSRRVGRQRAAKGPGSAPQCRKSSTPAKLPATGTIAGRGAYHGAAAVPAWRADGGRPGEIAGWAAQRPAS